MQNTAQNRESAVCKRKRPEDDVERSECGVAGPGKRQHLDRGEEYMVPDRIFLPEEIFEATDTGEIASSLKNRYERTPAAFSKKGHCSLSQSA